MGPVEEEMKESAWYFSSEVFQWVKPIKTLNSVMTYEKQSRGQEDLKRSLQGAGIWSDLEGGSGFGQTQWGWGGGDCLAAGEGGGTC